MTGPAIGSIIGFLIGLRPWVNLVVVLASTYIAIGIWALLLNELSSWAATVDRFSPYALVFAIVLIAVGLRLLHRRRDRPAALPHRPRHRTRGGRRQLRDPPRRGAGGAG